jgi:zinc protease
MATSQSGSHIYSQTRISILALSVAIAMFNYCVPKLKAATGPSTPSKTISSKASSTIPASSKAAVNPAFTFVREAAGLQEYKLKSNGLSVLLGEKHTAPVLIVNVVYRVGSRNEAVGYTGATHFLEHMMFKGTAAHDPLKGTGLDDLLKPLGGYNNATTFYDRTNYYEVVPSKDLAVCIDIEADRMRHALLRKGDRESEMTVVRNELERGENYASSILDTLTYATAFREHPYHHPVIGWRSDVEGVPLERLKQFYNDFYYPNNATLIILGDFKTADALNLIAKNFSSVPPSPKPFPNVYTVEPPQEGERRFVVQRGDELPKLMFGYHIPKATDKDTYPLEVLASILGDEKRQSSRLYKRLVDTGLASEANCSNTTLRDPGLFTISASATGDTKLETIEKSIEDELKKLAEDPVSDNELDRAKKAVWKRIKLDATDIADMAQQLTEAIAIDTWMLWVNMESKIKAVTAADVQRVAKKYFDARNRTVGYYYPKEAKTGAENAEKKSEVPAVPQNFSTTQAATRGRQDAGAPGIEAPNSSATTLSEKHGQSESAVVPPASNDESFSMLNLIAAAAPGSPSDDTRNVDPHISTDLAKRSSSHTSTSSTKIAKQIKKKVLANGITVYTLQIPGSGCVSVAGKLKAGACFGSYEKGLLPSFVSEMLNKGTKSTSKEQFADAMERMGTTFDPDAENFWTEFKADVVKEDLEAYLKLASEALREPLFETAEVDKVKKQTEAALTDAMVETGQLAQNKLLGAIYKKDCVYYEKSFAEQIDEIKTISSDELKEFHKKYYVGANTVLAIVGDIGADEAFGLAEKTFANLEKGSPVSFTVDACANQAAKNLIVSNLKDKTSVDIVIGQPIDVSIKSKDFFAAEIVNSALGHDTISSRLAELRNKYGLTYGVDSSITDVSEPYSAWQISLSVNPENTKKAISLLRSIVSNYYKKGITADELATEKKRLAGEYIVNRLRTPSQLASVISRYSILGIPMEFIDEHAKNLDAVTMTQANAAIKKFMNINDCAISVAGSVPADVK